MAGTIKLGGNTIATHTGAVGGGTVTLEAQNIKLPDSGGVISSNAITISSTGKVTTADSELNVKTTSHTFTVKGVDEAIGDSQSGTAPDTTDSDSGQFAVYNGSTKLFGITEHGYVLKPNHPFAFVSRDIGKIISGNVVVFNVENSDTANVYNTSNGRFTAPVAGKYMFTHGMFSTNTSGAWLLYRVNGSAFASSYNEVTSYADLGTTVIADMQAGDYFDFYVTTGSTYEIYGGYALQCWAQMYLLG